MVELGVVQGRVLEIGSRDWQGGAGNMSEPVRAAGLEWQGCDIEPGPGVDFQLDIFDVAAVGEASLDPWDTVLLFNLLEHVYDPATALRNAVALVKPGGAVVVCGPAVWEIHDYPRDYWRPLPDFYREFAIRHGLELVDDGMAWVLTEWPYIPRRSPITRVIRVGDLPQLPSRLNASEVWGRSRASVSTAIQRGLNLTGRVNRFPNVGLGVVLVRGAGESPVRGGTGHRDD